MLREWIRGISYQSKPLHPFPVPLLDGLRHLHALPPFFADREDLFAVYGLPCLVADILAPSPLQVKKPLFLCNAENLTFLKGSG
jgi:hypothetical protein